MLLPAAALAQDAEPLLDRYRPILRYEAAEKYLAQPAVDPRSPDKRDADRVHGHVAREEDRTWLQYWLFFAENTQDRGIVDTGRHQGDWELLQVGLGKGGEPETVTFSQHSSAEACRWDEIERDGDAPVAYVANGSHALYPYAGVADRPFPDPNDEARGEGEIVRPRVTSGGRWRTYDGRWGSSRAGIVPGEQSSPRGPPFQESGAWDRPASYHDAARPCGSDPPGRWWTLPALAIAFAAIAGVVLLLIRRVRR